MMKKINLWLLIRICLSMLLMSCLSGCTTTQPAKLTTLTLQSSADINPNLFGRPSPIAITVYQLTDADAFKQADYFALQNQAATLLGKDLLTKKSLFLLPNESRKLEINLDNKTRYLGVIAGYTELDAGTWRTTLPLSNKNKDLALSFERNSIKNQEQ